MKPDHIIALVAFNTSVQLAHWQASSKTNEHRALGDLYGRMVELTDDFAELVLGKNGNRDLPTVKSIPLAGLVSLGIQTVLTARSEITDARDEDLANILADMSAALNKAKYLLEIS